MTGIQNILLIGLLLSFTLLEYAMRRAQKFNTTASDNTLDLLGFALLAVFSQPLILWITSQIGIAVAPQAKNSLGDLPWYAMVGLLLVFDDMLQYWWHRASHSPLLWPLHRAHHSATYMSARMIYRNNFFYYLGMPAIWMSGFLVYLGLGEVYLWYILVKLSVIAGAHSAVRWDEPLLKIKALAPIMWVVQRTISTPTTHFAHHAITDQDGIGHYKGNFGNLLFFWDILFGSAYITPFYPAKVGLRDDELFGAEKWWVELFYPLFQSRRVHSAMVPGGKPYEEPVKSD